MTLPISVALYARVSSHRQAEHQTIDSQKQSLINRIDKDGFSLDESMIFCDDGFSGAELHRPALEVLRDRVAASLIDRVYVLSADRLARKHAHQAILIEEFKKAQCEIVFCDHDGLGATAESNLLLQIQGVIAEYEREKILERTRRGKRHSAKQGNPSVFSSAPYGYKYIKPVGESSRAYWQVDETESEHVKMIFHWSGIERMSLAAICRELERRQIKTRTGLDIWCSSTIRDMLKNPAYVGQARYGRTRLVPRKTGNRAKRGDPAIPLRAKVSEDTQQEEQIVIAVPAIIEQSLFNAAAEVLMENRSKMRQRRSGSTYMLSGLVVCGHCGSAYCARTNSKNCAYFYYRCIGREKRSRLRGVSCSNGAIRGSELEGYVWNDVCELLSDKDRLSREFARRQTCSVDFAHEISEAESQVSQTQSRINRLIDAFENGLIDKPELEPRLKKLREEKARHQWSVASLKQQSNDLSNAASIAEAMERFSESIAGTLTTASADTRRELCKLLIKRVEIRQEEIEIVYKVPQRPFDQSPASRGILQYWLLRPHASRWHANASTWREPVALRLWLEPRVLPVPAKPPNWFRF